MPTGTVTVRGVAFTYEERGEPAAPLALVLHGFPDTPVEFLPLLDELGQAGYRAIAPWARGYAPTSLAPDGEYAVGSLAADANALHDALGGDGDAVLIGHDWGASAVYPALCAAPQRWRRAVAMSVPPMPAMLRALHDVRQLQRSWYMWLFNTPLGRPALAANDMALVDHLWAQWSPGLDPADAAVAIAAVKAALATPERQDAALASYRSIFAGPPTDADALAAQLLALERPTVPVCYLHGADDGCIALDAIGDVHGDLPPGSEVVVIAEAGHFLHVERLDAVTDAVRSFLSR